MQFVSLLAFVSSRSHLTASANKEHVGLLDCWTQGKTDALSETDVVATATKVRMIGCAIRCCSVEPGGQKQRKGKARDENLTVPRDRF